MSGYMVNWITLALVFLLPLIPAFVLYRFLSAQGEVGGTLFGVPIKLGGSIAGYVVVLLIAVNFSNGMEERETYERLTLTGSVKLEGLAADEVDYRLLDISYVPRREEITAPYGDGMVDWSTFVIQPTAAPGEHDRAIADVLISYAGFKTQKLTLSAVQPSPAGVLKFEPVVLQKKRSTNPDGGTNVVVLDP
jgi:hypothetical protein